MSEITSVRRLTDTTFEELVENEDRPFLLLFESRYDVNVCSMLELLQFLLSDLEYYVCVGVCMVEDAPKLAERFNIYGVPTFVVGHEETLLGEVLGPRSRGQLRTLIRTWLAAWRSGIPRVNHQTEYVGNRSS